MTDVVARANKLFRESQSEEALEILRQAAQSDDTEAKFQLGLIYYEGEYVPIDLESAREWFEKADLGGHTVAPLYLGTLCAREAKKLYKRSAQRGCHIAMARMGNVYLYGVGVQPSLDLALEYFQKAKEAGNLFAGIRYARMLILGRKGFGGVFVGFYELFKALFRVVRFSRSHAIGEIRERFSA